MATIDSRIRLITTENRGVAVARNVGIDAAQGTFMAFVDSDDLVAQNYLEVMRNVMTNDTQIATVEYTDNLQHLHMGATYSKSRILRAKDALIESLYQRNNRGGINASLWGKLFRRELFEGLRCTPGILYEDLDMVYRLLLRSQQISSVPAIMYYYRARTGSITHTFNARRLSVIAVCERLCDYPEVKASPELFVAARDRLFSASYNMLLLMWRHHHHDDEMLSGNYEQTSEI
jgi:glycosyltransferase involved in cell wall biosynthesis